MNKKTIIAVVVILGSTAFFLSKKEDSSSYNNEEIHHNKMPNKLNKSKDQSRAEAIEKNKQHKEAEKLSPGMTGEINKTQFKPQNKEEISLHQFNEQLAVIYENKDDPDQLIEYFKSESLAPEMSVESNEYTGTMKMIRTAKSLPGTRYYHAQYMGDDPDNTFLQHISFEFKPGDNSMQRAIESAESSYALSNKRIFRNGDFITYDIGDEGTHELSIEKASYESLKDDPFNAYTQKDDGTVITRIEMKVHDSNSEGDGHVH